MDSELGEQRRIRRWPTGRRMFGWAAALAMAALLLAGFVWALPQRIVISVYGTPFDTGKPLV